jgi:tripeptide aminopeptidase
MISGYQHTVTERFLRYVQIDTQSNPHSDTFPTTEKQKNLLSLLATELKAIGLDDAHMDEHGYVYATIPGNTSKDVPVICFCSHADTTIDCSGTNVQPIVHHNYQGQNIVLSLDENVVLSAAESPYLLQHIGNTVITASGNTLLGADDKAGISIIMDLANYLQTHPEVKHGAIKVLFTPDEEVGRGAEKVDLKKLGAQFGYTLDGGEAGTYGLILTIQGISAHPGTAKNVMVNAIKVASAIIDALPKKEWCPEQTAQRAGFVHPVHLQGTAEQASIEFILRSFNTADLAAYQQKIETLAKTIISQWPGAGFTCTVKEQYRNMKEIVDQYPQITANTIKAYQRAGLTMVKEPIRGGTDGSKLSFMGLPCPNIFTGMQNIHSKKEWVGVKDMEKAVEVLSHLVQVWEQEA